MARTDDFAAHIRAKLAADPDLAAAIDIESVNADIARNLYAARTAAGLTQRQLAAKVGTHQSVISRIEDADYDGHSLSLLKRIAKALGRSLRIDFPDGQGKIKARATETIELKWSMLPGNWAPKISQSISVGKMSSFGLAECEIEMPSLLTSPQALPPH